MVCINLLECVFRLRGCAPESSLSITLHPLRRYASSGSPARLLPIAIPVSAGVSRKRVHLFRRRSYFQKAFTGPKTTTSRERLPNLCLPLKPNAIQSPGSGATRVTGRRRQSLTNHHHHFLIVFPEPYGPCTPSRQLPAARQPHKTTWRRPVPHRRQHASRATGIHSQAVMTSLLPLRSTTTPRTC